MGVSRRKYAEMRGVSHTAVGKAIKSGRITPEPDGTIDPVKVDRQWATQTDPAKQRGPNTQAMGAAATKPVPRSAIDAVGATLSEAGAATDQTAGGVEVSFIRARLANEVLKAQTTKVKLAKMKGELVDLARATAIVFDLARSERESWLIWPPRVAESMAAELGVDPHQMEQVLDKYLRKHLVDMAEVKIELR